MFKMTNLQHLSYIVNHPNISLRVVFYSHCFRLSKCGSSRLNWAKSSVIPSDVKYARSEFSTDKKNTKFPITNCTNFSLKEPLRKTVSGRLFTPLLIKISSDRRNTRSFSYKIVIERFHSRDQHLCIFIGTKKCVYIRKEFNSRRFSLEHQHGRSFIVLEHQYGRRDVM